MGLSLRSPFGMGAFMCGCLAVLFILSVVRQVPVLLSKPYLETLPVTTERSAFGMTLLMWLKPSEALRSYGDGNVRREKVYLVDTLGVKGYRAELTTVVLDRWALADPLRARLPSDLPPLFLRVKPGHLPRSLPGGYTESVRRDRNLIQDPSTAYLYDDILLLTRGPLFSVVRWRVILRRTRP